MHNKIILPGAETMASLDRSLGITFITLPVQFIDRAASKLTRAIDSSTCLRLRSDSQCRSLSRVFDARLTSCTASRVVTEECQQNTTHSVHYCTISMRCVILSTIVPPFSL